MSNLKVNAKTHPLTFKRKHNLLVEDVEEVKETVADLPTETDVEHLIQADKDVLSKITVEYDSDNDKTLVNFPPNIMPLAFGGYSHYGNLFILFKVYKFVVVNSTQTEIGDLRVNSNNSITFVISGNVVSDFDINRCSYIIFNGGTNAIFSTYYIYHPVTSSGTKLYRHDVSFGSGGNLTFISAQLTKVVNDNIDIDKIIRITGCSYQGGYRDVIIYNGLQYYKVKNNCIAIFNNAIYPVTINDSTADLTTGVITFGLFSIDTSNKYTINSDTVTEL